MARPHTLTRPVSIQDVENGGSYRIPPATFSTSNLFFDIVCIDSLYIKVLSSTGQTDFRNYISLARSTSEDARALEPDEQFEQLTVTAARYPAFGPVLARHIELAHILVVLTLQYERMQENRAVGVPDTRFGLLASGRILRSDRAAAFQERIEGTTLWEMFDFDNEVVRPEWESHLPSISAQLAPLVDAPLARHIDWNIQNFVFRPDDERLFYVDVKPTTLVRRTANDHNLNGVRQYFIL